MDIIRVRPVLSAFKDELAIVIDDHGEAVTIEVVVLDRGSGPEFSSSFFFWREAKFFEALGRTKKNRQTVKEHKALF